LIESGISTVSSIDSAAVQLGNGRVKDMKMWDDNLLLVLWETKGKLSSSLSMKNFESLTALQGKQTF
jgi:hypothetical protein